MEESTCIVCFLHYDEDENRPRVLPCGHTICSDCLMKSIRQDSKICPKCRRIYVASNVKDLPVNFSLESLVKSGKTSEKIPECAEHLLQVTHRCSSHKAWICQSCINEDHSLKSCKIITISEELKNKKALQLDQSKPLVDAFEKICKTSDNYKILYKKLMEDIDEDIMRFKTIVDRVNEQITTKTAKKIQIAEMYEKFDQKQDTLKCQRKSYDKAVATLMSTNTIREVSRGSVEVRSEAVNLQLITHEMEKEVIACSANFQKAVDISYKSGEQCLGNHKLSIRNGEYHLHGFQKKNPTKSSALNLQFSDGDDHPLTDGILTFLDIAWPGQERRRVYMKMLGNTVRARQHLLLVTGHCGYSYKGLNFYKPNNVEEPGACIILRPYDGLKATPLLNNVNETDVANHGVKAGLMCCACFDGDSNNALFSVILNDNPERSARTVFGQVTSGLNVLKDLANSEEIDQIKVVDCGIVIMC